MLQINTNNEIIIDGQNTGLALQQMATGTIIFTPYRPALGRVARVIEGNVVYVEDRGQERIEHKMPHRRYSAVSDTVIGTDCAGLSQLEADVKALHRSLTRSKPEHISVADWTAYMEARLVADMQPSDNGLINNRSDFVKFRNAMYGELQEMIRKSPHMARVEARSGATDKVTGEQRGQGEHNKRIEQMQADYGIVKVISSIEAADKTDYVLAETIFRRAGLSGLSRAQSNVKSARI